MLASWSRLHRGDGDKALISVISGRQDSVPAAGSISTANQRWTAVDNSTAPGHLRLPVRRRSRRRLIGDVLLWIMRGDR